MHNASGLDVRKSAFIKVIMNMSNTNESGEIFFTYCVDGITVCKNFYFRATGLNRKLFNRGIAFVSCREDDEQDQHVFTTLSEKSIFTHICGYLPFFRQEVSKSNNLVKNDSEHIVLAFLDIFFKENVNVDHAPEESNVRYVRDTWQGVYEEYIKHCPLLQSGGVKYSKFTSIR
jgi:hypothetical protein